MNARETFQFVTRNDDDLTGLSDSEIDTYLELAVEDLGPGAPDIYGNKYKRATALLAAHLAAQFEGADAGEAGGTTSKSAGGVSVSKSAHGADSEYDETGYGRRFKSIRNTRVGGGHSV